MALLGYGELKKEEDWQMPLYDKVSENFMLVGVSHSKKSNAISISKKSRFKKLIRGTDRLAFEANERAHEMNELLPRMNLEKIARQIHPGPYHYLEEGVDFGEVLERYGMPTDLSFFYQLAFYVQSSANRGQAPMVVKGIERFMEEITGQSPSYAAVEEEDTAFTHLLKFTLSLKEGRFEEWGRTVSAFIHYRSRARDAGVFVPKLQEMGEGSDDRITAIIGANHIPYVGGALRGEPPYEMVDWETFVSSLETEDQEAIAYMKELHRREVTRANANDILGDQA